MQQGGTNFPTVPRIPSHIGNGGDTIENRIYGYIRVSSTDQNEDRQWIALHKKGVEDRFIYVDQQSGRDFDRPQYQKMVKKLKPGDLLYAIVDVGVNSDVPSAVLATVTSGAYRNARLMGGFQRHDERLVLAFNRAVLPSGETVQLEAYAVDPSTSEASVASSVDTHFFSRWGGLVASAFLEGLGSAKRYSGAQSTIYGYGNDTTDQMVWNEYSVEDQAWIAAGKVGEKAGKIFEKGFDRPPTVRLESGTPVGVLILNVKGR